LQSNRIKVTGQAGCLSSFVKVDVHDALQPDRLIVSAGPKIGQAKWKYSLLRTMAFLHREGRFAIAPTPVIILLDLNLPRKDGREVLSEIKADPNLKRIPVVIFTTSQAESDLIKSYNLHARRSLRDRVSILLKEIE